MSYVYILKSLKDGRFYIGSTANLRARLKHHFAGHTPSTSRMGKLILVFSQEYQDLSVARKIEKKLKMFKRKDFIEKIIQDRYIKIT
jgi:putative endonuclease